MKVRVASFHKTTLLFCALGVIGVLTDQHGWAREPPAFPGAEGFGRFAKGGRGGQVMEVTNIGNSGPGSLRAALEASGPRTVVFRVSGTIELSDKIDIVNPFITIAGQTAPRDGIQIRGGWLLIKTHDVVIRYIRVRPGNLNAIESLRDSDGIQIVSPSRDVIIDHVSASWATDECISISSQAGPNITVQWCISSEGLKCPEPRNVDGRCHGMGLMVAWGSSGVSVHHNLIACQPDRNPLIASGDVDLCNNLMYNFKASTTFWPSQGVVRANLVNNMYVWGPNSESMVPVRLYGGQTYNAGSGAYLKGNVHATHRPDDSLPEEDIAYRPGGNPELAAMTTRFNFPTVTITDAFQAEIDVLDKAGASFPRRDPVDSRVVDSVRNGTGQFIDDPSEVGGWPNLPSDQRPSTHDSDGDGMPNSWETAQKLDPNNASDGPQDADADGYTNLEEYLNGLVDAGNPPPAPSKTPNPPGDIRLIPTPSG